jgi:hypothetical protein
MSSLSQSEGSTFSNLQHLLQLSYSDDGENQQLAAIELSKLVEDTIFPAVSFGPLVHALCKLVPNTNRTTSSFAARAVKMLILDDALRPQAIIAGVPQVICGTIKYWDDDVTCLRELLGVLQTLCWDKLCVKHVIKCDIIAQLIDFIGASDHEVSMLALATITNIMSFCDTLFLADDLTIDELGQSLLAILQSMRTSQQRPQRFYACAALANASSHPRLAHTMKLQGALDALREVERQALSNVHILGSRLGDSARTAVYRLSDKKEGDARSGFSKYSFKWGTKSVIELSLSGMSRGGYTLWVCFGIWIIVVLVTFMPIVFA